MSNARSLFIALLLLGIACLPVCSFADAKSDIDATLEELVAAAEEFKGDTHKKERRAAMRKIIEPRFDFEEMARRSLGAQWRKCSGTEQVEFVELFSELLASTYLGKIDMLERGMVEVVAQKEHSNRALVKTMVSYKGDTFGLDYKLIEKDSAWKVYDVIIENIGLVANYRNEFSGIIRKEKFSGLLEKLKEKVEKKNREEDTTQE